MDESPKGRRSKAFIPTVDKQAIKKMTGEKL